MCSFGMNEILKTYLKLIVKPQIAATAYYQQSSLHQEGMRDHWLAKKHVSCYIFSLVYISIAQLKLSKPNRHFHDAYDYLFNSGSRDLLRRGDFLWNHPDSQGAADQMFNLAMSNVDLITSQLESGQTPDYSVIRNVIEKTRYSNA